MLFNAEKYTVSDLEELLPFVHKELQEGNLLMA